jgi:hypothetical protein
LHDRRSEPLIVGVLLSAPHPALRTAFPIKAGEGAIAGRNAQNDGGPNQCVQSPRSHNVQAT